MFSFRRYVTKPSIQPLILACSLFIATSLQAAAEQQIEEIVVYGDFRQADVSQLPASVSVIRLGSTGQTQVNHLEEVLGWAANVNFSSGGSRARFIQIRGIGERSQFVEPFNPSVGIVLNGADLTGIGTAATLYDVSQVEIFRGPQGTLYGANALAGLINIVSNAPEDTFGGRVDLDLGDYGAQGLGAVFTGPLGERAQFRFAIRQYQDDGFIKNTFLGRDDTNNRDELTLRGRVDWQLGDYSEIEFQAGFMDSDNGYDAFSLDNDRRTRSDEPGSDQQESSFLSAAWSYTGAASYDLEVSAAFTNADVSYGYDEDWTFTGFHPFGYTSTDQYERERSSQQLEVRLVSKPGAGLFEDQVDWVVGTYALQQDAQLDRNYTFSAPFDSEFDFDRNALYGELGGNLTDRLRLTTGLRLERHRSKYSDNQGVRFSPSETLVGGRVLLELDLADNSLLYLGWNRGYKMGLFNTDGSLDADLRSYDSETAWSLEAGIKTSFMQDRLLVNAAVFYMQRDDMQVSTSITRVRANGSSEFIQYSDNAAGGTNFGLEADLTWQLTDQLSAFGSIGLLDTELEKFVNGNGNDLDRRDQSQAPGYQFFVGLDYAPTDSWFARIELEGRDDYFLSDSHQERAPSYELVNLSLGYRTDVWSVRLWARNLTDEDYVTRGFFFGNDPRDGYTGRGFNQFGEPRNYGVSLGWEF